MASEVITLGGGCFWCVEAVYGMMKGVTSAESGYMGGKMPNPSYQLVCTGTTGHAEVVRVTFDNDVVTLDEILDVFFTVHDPTTLNRQGADVGTQYRSAIFTENDEQAALAQSKINELNQLGKWDNPIVTEVSPSSTFYKAEAYHQDYFTNNPNQGYCRVVIAPKVNKFRTNYADKLK